YGPVEMVQWGTPSHSVDYFDVKGDVEELLAPMGCEFRPGDHPSMHPGRCASVWREGACIGHVGELHPKWRQRYELPQPPVLFELSLEAVSAGQVPVFSPVSRFQPVERDLAIVVNETITHAAVMAAVKGVGDVLLRDAVLFDVYRPKKGAEPSGAGALATDEKSLAVRLFFSRDDANLTDAEVDAVVQRVLGELERRVSARLRA
ncbi:MAG: phenylalanine--tRNA ligase subunit beta, partial [Burkholderiaceae bacterium]